MNNAKRINPFKPESKPMLADGIGSLPSSSRSAVPLGEKKTSTSIVGVKSTANEQAVAPAQQVGAPLPTSCENAQLIDLLTKFEYFVKELKDAVSTRRVVRSATCELLERKMALMEKNFSEELRRATTKMLEQEERVHSLENELQNVRFVLRNHDQTVKKVDQLIVDHVIGAAEDKDKYRGIVEGLVTLIDVVSQRTAVHKAIELRNELYEKLMLFLRGELLLDEVCSYLQSAKTDSKALQYCHVNADSWDQSIDTLQQLFVKVFSGIGDLNALSQKYDNCNLSDLTIYPQPGESFNRALMESREIEESDTNGYVVESVVKLGIRKSSVQTETRKAQVKVSV